MAETPKRESLCVEAVNGPVLFLGTTVVGWLVTPPLTWVVGHCFGLNAGVMTAILSWCVPIIISKNEPYLLTAMIRSLLVAEFHDAD